MVPELWGGRVEGLDERVSEALLKKLLIHEQCDDRCLDQCECYHEETRNKFVDTLDWLREWACSRSYGLGSRLPWDEQWLIESLSDSTIYMAYYTIAHYLQGSLDGSQKGLGQFGPEDFTDSVLDFCFLNGTTAPSDSKIPLETLKKMQSEFQYFYPLDLRVSGKDLVPNHLSFFLFNHTAIFPKQYWPRSIRANGHLLLNSEKMSKSTGNFMTLRESVERYGADAARLVLADAGDAIDDANFVEQQADSFILRLYTQLDFYLESYGKPSLTLTGATFTAFRPETAPFNFHDKYFEAEMNSLVVEATRNFEK